MENDNDAKVFTEPVAWRGSGDTIADAREMIDKGYILGVGVYYKVMEDNQSYDIRITSPSGLSLLGRMVLLKKTAEIFADQEKAEQRGMKILPKM